MQQFYKWTRLPANKQPLEWRDFEDAGYPFVDLNVHPIAQHWKNVHQWCKSEIGSANYTWTGNRFWFLNSEDALVFGLVWG